MTNSQCSHSPQMQKRVVLLDFVRLDQWMSGSDPCTCSEKSAIYTYDRSAMPEGFDAYTEREEQSMQHPHSWELWHEEVLDVDIGARIPVLQCVEEPDNRVII